VNKTLRSPIVLVTAGVLLLIVVIWLFVFFFPQQKKITQANAKHASLLQEQQQLQAQVAALQALKVEQGPLTALQTKYSTAVPPTAENFPYYTQMNNLVGLSGLKLTGGISVGSTSAAVGNGIYAIAVSVGANGTYDDLLSFINGVYANPRLTTIQSITISGGGIGTSRSTSLTATFSMQIYTTQPPVAAVP
jgi:Tfp pilus assembly protein PilO